MPKKNSKNKVESINITNIELDAVVGAVNRNLGVNLKVIDLPYSKDSSFDKNNFYYVKELDDTIDYNCIVKYKIQDIKIEQIKDILHGRRASFLILHDNALYIFFSTISFHKDMEIKFNEHLGWTIIVINTFSDNVEFLDTDDPDFGNNLSDIIYEKTNEKTNEEQAIELARESEKLLIEKVANKNIEISDKKYIDDKDKGEKIIFLIADKTADNNVVLSCLKNHVLYKSKSIQLVNFYALLDKDKSPYLLKCIDTLKSIGVQKDTDSKMKLYEEFKIITKDWFKDLSKYKFDGLICKRVYNSNRFKTPNMVSWLYGYYCVGKKVMWLDYNKSTLTFSESKLSKITQIEDARILRSAKDYLSAKNALVASSIYHYIVLGCINSFIADSDTLIWKSDNNSFESFIARFFGYAQGDFLHSNPIDILVNIDGTTIGSKATFDECELFLKRYYNLV